MALSLQWHINAQRAHLSFGRTFPMTGNTYTLEVTGGTGNEIFFVMDAEGRECLAKSVITNGSHTIAFNSKRVWDSFVHLPHEMLVFHVLAKGTDGNIVGEGDIPLMWNPLWADAETGEVYSMKGPQGSPGESGADGVGIVSITRTTDLPDGSFVYNVNLSNGRSYPIVAPRGLQGEQGKTMSSGYIYCESDQAYHKVTVVTNIHGVQVLKVSEETTDSDSIEPIVIGGAQTITGAKTFTAPITASGGVVGNVTGDVTGDVTGNVTGDVTGDLNGNVTGNLSGNVTGNLTGNVTGNVTGSLTGNITGDCSASGEISAQTIVGANGVTSGGNVRATGDIILANGLGKISVSATNGGIHTRILHTLNGSSNYIDFISDADGSRVKLFDSTEVNAVGHEVVTADWAIGKFVGRSSSDRTLLWGSESAGGNAVSYPNQTNASTGWLRHVTSNLGGSSGNGYNWRVPMIGGWLTLNEDWRTFDEIGIRLGANGYTYPRLVTVRVDDLVWELTRIYEAYGSLAAGNGSRFFRVGGYQQSISIDCDSVNTENGLTLIVADPDTYINSIWGINR